MCVCVCVCVIHSPKALSSRNSQKFSEILKNSQKFSEILKGQWNTRQKDSHSTEGLGKKERKKNQGKKTAEDSQSNE